MTRRLIGGFRHDREVGGALELESVELRFNLAHDGQPAGINTPDGVGTVVLSAKSVAAIEPLIDARACQFACLGQTLKFITRSPSG